jgi:choice-of-anchor B domain-containing protein
MKIILLLLVCLVTVYGLTCQEDPKCAEPAVRAPLMNKVMPIKTKEWAECAATGKCPLNTQDLTNLPCKNGMAGEYPCQNVDLLAFLSLKTLTATGAGNDIWGWVDSQGREIAIMGTYERTVFVDVTNPTNPSVLGFLPTHTVGSSWRDIKVYRNHAFIISEARQHGMQVFDLTQLESLPRYPAFSSNYTLNAPVKFAETAHYGQFGNCHNIAINEDTGFAYGIGSNTCGGGGLHIIDIHVPASPTYAGCFGGDGYVHDTQCVVYDGPDPNYQGREICFCYNEEHLTIVDVTSKSSPSMISTIDYQGVQYTHQGWLLPGKRYLLLDDELDELYGTNAHTRTLVWDVANLKLPRNINSFYSTETVIDHNLYTLGNRAYQSNYCGGLRILDTSNVVAGLSQAGFFDVAPDCSTTSFLGTWSNYPYFPSRNIVVSSIDRGLFIVKSFDPDFKE